MGTPQDEIIKFISEQIQLKTTQENPQAQEKSFNLIKQEFGSDFMVTTFTLRKRPIMVLSNTKKRKVDFILAGHIDVVPGLDEQFRLKIKGDKLCGRGILDMKGPLTAGLFAIRDWLKQSNNLKIAIFITADEEIDGLSTEYLLSEQNYKSDFAILPDGGEATKIVREQKGFLQIKAAIQGKTAHAARPWQGENPILKGLFLTQKLLTRFPQPKSDQAWKTSIALTKVKAGKVLNQIPEIADFCFDIRYVSPKDKQTILDLLNKECHIELLAENGIFRVAKSNPHLKKLQRVIEKVAKQKVELSRECATSDAIFFTENGVPAVLFRPKGGNPHAENEWLSKKSLFNFYRIVYNFLEVFVKS